MRGIYILFLVKDSLGFEIAINSQIKIGNFNLLTNYLYSLFSDKYLIGSEDKLELSMNITNEGEDAYEAALYVHLPQHVSYIKTEMIGTNPSEMVSVLCSPPTLENDFVLKCDLGNPMMGFSKVSTYFPI